MKLFDPTYRFSSVFDITPGFLKQESIRLLIFDIDNTLVKHGAPADERASRFLGELKNQGIELAFLSNNSRMRLDQFNRALGFYSVAKAGKPRRKGYYDILRYFGVAPGEAAAVGDQLFTDIAGGNRAGLRTILVNPIHPEEPWFVRVKRRLERLFYKR